MARCPECESTIEFNEAPVPAEVITCPSCKVDFEVIGTDPVDLIRAPEIEEDWGE